MGFLDAVPKMVKLITGKGAGMKTGKGVNISDHSVTTMDGGTKSLSDWSGQVLMLVNVASKCGLTPQYAQLVNLHDEYKGRGFSVIGFPANNFMGQEPGSDEDISNFCSTKYGVNFDVLSKISVQGNDIHPMYADLVSVDKNGELGGDIEWNFAKFIVDKQGNVVGRVHPKTLPDDPAVIACIEAELGRD